MFLRALIVLLLALNLGVALWWALRPPAADPGVPDPPPGVARLQLVEEASPEARATAASVAAPDGQAPLANADADIAAAGEADGSDGALPEASAEADAAAAAERAAGGAGATAAAVARCLSLGPFDDAAALGTARAALQPRVQRLQAREVVSAPRGWRVMLPPHADRAAAQAVAQKLGASGFDDHFVIGEGSDANAIALGRFSGETAARRHVAALRAAGFPAQAEPLGETSVRHWLDLGVGEAFDADAARADTGAQRADPLDCAQLR